MSLQAERLRLSPVALGAVGTAATTCLVVAAGRAAVPIGVTLEPSFGGLLSPATAGGTASAVVVLLSLAVLVRCWWTVVERAARQRLSLSGVAAVGLAWTLPVLLGPPLLSLDAYAYLAQGEMLTAGYDPYAGGPILLGADRVAARVDPTWRAAPTPYGPVALVLFRTVAGASEGLTAGVLLLRLLAVLGVAGAVISALLLCRAAARPHVLALTLLNPMTVVHLVGGVHLDAVLAGLTGMSLLALHRRRPWVACALAVLAVAVKVTVLPLLLFVVFALWRSGRPRGQLAVGVTALALLPYALTLPLVPRPAGFLFALSVPGSSAPWYAPATILGQGLEVVGDLLSLPVEQATLSLAGRCAAVLLGGLALALLCRAELRDQGEDRAGSVRRAGTALVLVALSLPALYAWYLAAGLFVTAAAAGRHVRVALVALSSALAFSSLPPLYGAGIRPLVVTGVAVLALLGARIASAMIRNRTVGSGTVSVPAAATVTEMAPRRHSSAPRRRLQAATIGVLVAVAVGSVATSAGAERDPALRRQTKQKMRLVTYLQQNYPQLQVVGFETVPGPGAQFRVQMVLPGKLRCELLLDLGPGPTSQPLRVAAALTTVRSTTDRACPPQPLARPGRELRRPRQPAGLGVGDGVAD
ncbi:MAG: polyprenol phosphomannose-dependent alpha 1,6 mannosyltransferase MptB [Mycobacteriales bacterium]